MKERIRNLDISFEIAPAITIEPVTRAQPEKLHGTAQQRPKTGWKWMRFMCA